MIVASMLSAITPKVPITVVANQGIAGMDATVQVGACEVLFYVIYLGSPILTAHTELLGPVTVPSLMRNRPPHSTWVVHRPKEFICARIVRWGLRFIVLIREH